MKFSKIEILKKNGWEHLGEFGMYQELFHKNENWIMTKTFDKETLYSMVRASSQEEASELLIDNGIGFTIELEELEKFLEYLR